MRRRRMGTGDELSALAFLAALTVSLYLLLAGTPQVQGAASLPLPSPPPAGAVILLAGPPGLVALVASLEGRYRLFLAAAALVLFLLPPAVAAAQARRVYAASDSGETIPPFREAVLANATRVWIVFHVDPHGDVRYWNGTGGRWWPAAALEEPEDVRVGASSLRGRGEASPSLSVTVQYFQYGLEYEIEAEAGRINATAVAFRYDVDLSLIGGGPIDELFRALTDVALKRAIEISVTLLSFALGYLLLKVRRDSRRD